MIGVIALSLSILVILSGLYLLSKSKKDSLGSLYVYSSYTAIILGGLLYAGTIVGATMMRHHHGARQASCYTSGGHGHSSCAGQSSCHMNKAQCKSGNSCSMGNSCMSKGNCSGNCEHGSMNSCGHGKHHGAMKHKKMMRKYHHGQKGNDDVEIEKEVEIEEVDEMN